MSFFWKQWFDGNEANETKEDRLLTIMRENYDRVTISRNGVVRVNLENDDVQKEIGKHIKKLQELEEFESRHKHAY